MEDALLHSDHVLEAVRLGKWQLVQYASLLTTYLTWATAILGITILGFVPDFACLPPGRGNTSSSAFQNLTFDSTCSYFNDTVNTSLACSDGFVYAEPKEASIVSDWDLACGLDFLPDLCQTVFTIGVSVGTVVFSPIADRYGRRKVVLWCQLLFLVVSLLNCLVPNITWFIVARFFMGVFVAAAGMAGWVLTLELFTARHRTMAALISNVIWSVCTLTLPAIGYLMKGYSWRYVQLALSLLALNVVIQFLFVDEAVRWLMANGRIKEAVTVIRKAAKQNGLSYENTASVIARFLSEDVKGENSTGSLEQEEEESRDKKLDTTVEFSDKTDSNVSARALITHPKLRRITLVMFLAWFTNSMTYVGLYMLSMTMPGDRYLNLFLSSIVETPAALILFPVVLRCGRRKVLIALHLLAAVSLIGAAILHVTTENSAGHIALTTVIMLGKFSIAATYSLVFMYTPELYPTNIRSVGVGVVSIASRIGGLLSPFAATVARAVPWVPAAVFGGFCLLVALSCPLLPETRGKDLPQTLADLETLYSPERSTQHENVTELRM